MECTEVSRFDHHHYQSRRSDSFQNWVPLHKSLDNNSSSNSILDTFVLGLVEPPQVLKNILPIFKLSMESNNDTRCKSQIDTYFNQFCCRIDKWILCWTFQTMYLQYLTKNQKSNSQILDGNLICIDFLEKFFSCLPKVFWT